MNLVIDPRARKELEALAESKPSALILSGHEGVGLFTIAKWLAEQWGQTVDSVTAVAKSKTAIPSISVERIRELYDTTKTKSSSNLIAVIDNADLMTEAAQNALLKLLEEPGSSMHFILTSHTPDTLLPTIRSRLQKIHVPLVDAVTSSRFIKSLGVKEESKVKQLLFVANGQPAAIARLINEPQALERKAETVRLARDFLNGDSYTRMVIINSIGNDRQQALHFLDTTLQILKSSLINASDDAIVNRIDRLLDAKEALVMNGNVRLQMATTVV